MAAGRQINLDENVRGILKANITNDFYACSPFLYVVFESQDKLVFGPSTEYYLTYYHIDWVPASFLENKTTNKTWHYEMTCLPRTLFTYITKPISNTGNLARALRLNLSQDSSSLPVPCPVINQFAGNLIQDFRFHSLEKSYVEKGHFGEASFIYVGTSEILSVTWKSLVDQTAKVFEIAQETVGANQIDFQDDQITSVFNSPHGAAVCNQTDFLYKMLGPKFTLHTPNPASFLSAYTMKFEDIPELDTGLSYLCIYSQKDCLKPNSYVHTFANIKYVR